MKSFAEQLPMIAGGALNDELTQAIADVLEYIDTHGGKPKITCEMEFGMQINKMGVMVKIAYRVTVKYPKEKPIDFTMFLTPEGNLMLDNPNQGNLPFKELKIEQPKPEVVLKTAKTAPEPIKVNPETGEIHD